MSDENKHSGVQMTEEELEDYNKVWSDMEDNFNNLEMIPEEKEDEDRTE